MIVRKERDLSHCSYRESMQYGPISSIQDLHSNIQSAPWLSSHQKIEQRFKRGILNKASSVETYNLKPFSNGDVGAKTVVQTTLTFKSDKGDSPNAAVSLPKSIIFEAPHPVVKSSVDSITAALKASNAEETNGVKPHAAWRFGDLLKVMRHSNKNDILSVYQKVKAGAGFDKNLDKKIFLDALFRTGSGEAVEVVVDLIKSREITGVQALMFYASLGLVNHVNLPAVTAVTSLLDQADLPRLGYLGIGQVIGKYCQQHTCENVAEVKQAIHKIREKVGNGKAKTREQENLIVSALKALGNSRYLDDSTLQKLAGIAEDKNVRNRVRVAAIEALPNRCSMKWKNILLKVLADREEDSEVRIKSYLSLVACPCPHVVNGVKETLDKEEVNQVGSFIQSHLRNLRASVDPNKAEMKRQLGMIKTNKFPEDFRKFSFNNELSYNLGSLGVGSSMESNVIYSQNSFMPRSMNLNMTTEIFGKVYNFLELSTRMENVDRLIEQYFGPKGSLMQDELDEMLDKGVNNTMDIVNYIKNRASKMRGKREVKHGELDKFAKTVKLRNNEVDENLNLDLSVKLFGVELAYMTYDGNSEHMTPERIIDKIFNNIEAGFSKVKKFDHTMQNHFQFIDAEITYPTNLGMPLDLSLVGTGVVHLRVHGKLDIQAIMQDPENADIRLGLEPSAVVDIVSKMVVKGFDNEAGLKVVGLLHTNTASDVTVKMLNGKGIDINFGIPKKKQEIISVHSKVLLVGPKSDEHKEIKIGKGKVYKDCFDQFSSIIGMTVCGHLEFPYDSVDTMPKRAFFPLNGPLKFNVVLEKNDVTNYHLKLYRDHKSFEILFDTPNSKTNRRVSLTGEMGTEPDKYAKLDFDSPFRKASAEARLKMNDQERSLMITVHNDQHEYFGRIGMLADGAKYKPILEYKVPEHIEKLTGGKGGAKGQQYNVVGTVEVVDQDGGKKYVFDKVALMVSDSKLVGVDGYVTCGNDGGSMDMNLGYGDESVALKMHGTKEEKNEHVRSLSVGLSAVPSKDPSIGFDIKWDLSENNGEYSHKFIFIQGLDPKAEDKRLTIKEHVIYSNGPLILSISNKITYPALKLLMNLDGKITPKTIDGKIKIGYDKFKFGTELSAKRDVEKPGDYEAEFEAELMQNSIKIESKRTILEPHKSKYKSMIEIKPGGKYELEAVLVRKRENKDKITLELDSDMNLNGKKVKAIGALISDPKNLNSRASVTVNDDKLLDFVLKLQAAGANPHGSLTLNLKNLLLVGGQMSTQDGKSTANLDIELPKFDRKIKGTGDLQTTGTQHTANFELLLDAEKDPSKRIKFSTVTDKKENFIDSKNVLEVLNNKFELNGKGKLEGTINEGELTADVDLTLPNGRYLVYKLKRNSAKKDDKYEVNGEIELVDHVTKGGASRKITLTGHGKKLDLKKKTGQAEWQLNMVDFNGDNEKLDLQLTNLHDSDGYKILHEIDMKLEGTQTPDPFKLNLKHSELDNGEMSCNAATSMGKEFQFKVSEIILRI